MIPHVYTFKVPGFASLEKIKILLRVVAFEPLASRGRVKINIDSD
jgi:hypothetical protein